jgi:hypothetical protein
MNTDNGDESSKALFGSSISDIIKKDLSKLKDIKSDDVDAKIKLLQNIKKKLSIFSNKN